MFRGGLLTMMKLRVAAVPDCLFESVKLRLAMATVFEEADAPADEAE